MASFKPRATFVLPSLPRVRYASASTTMAASTSATPPNSSMGFPAGAMA